jgi:hypothetical protein
MGIRPGYRTVAGVYPARNGSLQDALPSLVIKRLAPKAVAIPFPMQFQLIGTGYNPLLHLHFAPPHTVQGLGQQPGTAGAENKSKQDRNISLDAVHGVHGSAGKRQGPHLIGNPADGLRF